MRIDKEVHLIGIGGIGMSGLAHLLLEENRVVSGSDLSKSEITLGLEKKGAKVFIGHSSSCIHKDMTVVVSSGIKEENPEYMQAKALGCPILHRSDLLKLFSDKKRGIAVAGTHGKTTTSSLLTWVLHTAQKSPSFAVGGVIPQMQSNASHGDGDLFVFEADESDGSFTKYSPYGAIVTNIGLDHMDFYKSEEVLLQSFKKFLSQVQSEEHLFVCGDDKRLNRLKKGITYGFGTGCLLKASNFKQNHWSITFDVEFQGIAYSKVEVSLTGKHNALNALAVFGFCLNLGIGEDAIRRGLATFQGTKRRSEKKGEVQNVLFIDDYAHHPTEIMTTLEGIKKAAAPRRLVCVFQPHRYSRTRDCFEDFKKVFCHADILFVTDIYAAGEAPIDGVSSQKLVDLIGQKETFYVPQDHLVETVLKKLRPFDVVLTLGAGSITNMGPKLMDRLKEVKLRKYKVGIVCGGRSVEHSISLQTAQFFEEALNNKVYDVEIFKISQEGRWSQKEENAAQDDAFLNGDLLKKLNTCEVMIPALHGTFGEDGTIQGLFEMLNIPYVGPNHRSSAVAMDKGMTKSLLQAEGILTTPYLFVDKNDFDIQTIENQIRQSFGFPVFVKPNHLGSSIGVQRVEDSSALLSSLEAVFKIDTHALVEKEIVGGEFEFAVIGNTDPLVLDPGEIEKNGAIYLYDVKYGENALPINMKVNLPGELIEKGKEIALKVYKSLRITGFARIDFFLDENEFLVNEVNPIPGFTKSSFYPLVLKANQMYNFDFVHRQILLALERHRWQTNLSRT